MHPRTRQDFLAILVILAVGSAIAWAGSQGSTDFAGLPLFALCGAFAFGINWLVFIPAYAYQTERYFDLSGSLTYLSLTISALFLGPADPRARLLGLVILLWALRLGGFLFKRILEDGSDGRFDKLKPYFSRFLMTWTLQGLWVYLTISCALVAMTTANPRPAGPLRL